MPATSIGLAALKRALESLFGPLGVQPLSSQIYGLYTGARLSDAAVRRLLADRVLGQRRTVVLGAALMAIGHFMMAFEPLFLFALLALILGNGAFKPNISTQVGGLYAPGDPRRDRAYSIFYVGINLGAFLAPLVCGTLGEELGWHYGFAAAGVGMTASGSRSISTRCRMLPPDELQQGDSGRGRASSRSTATNGAPSSRCSCCSFPTRCSGRPTSSRATPSRSGPTPIPTAPSISWSGTAKSRSPGSRPSIRS